MQFLRLLPVAFQIVLRTGVVPVKLRAGELILDFLPIGMIQRDLNTELLHRRRRFKTGAVQIAGALALPALLAAFIHTVPQILHGLPALILLFVHMELSDDLCHIVHPVGNAAGVAVQGPIATFKQGFTVL